MAVTKPASTASDGATCISLVKVGKSYGKTQVLENVNLEIKSNELCVFVGPSGCGKSTLLRMIAGLESITSGDLFIEGKRMNEVEPSKRGIAMVFQSYALYPHMTVYENMRFGLKLAKASDQDADKRIREAAKMLEIEPLLQRLPKDLSGGQRQRVAIGRAVTRHANIFLLDEPLSNLDAALRVTMRSELSRLRKRLQTTMVYVTHDQVEAMTMADRLVVLNGGHVEQVGPPLQIYHRPETLFAAGFLGSPRMNFLKGTLAASNAAGVTVKLADGTEVQAAVSGDGVKVGDAVTLGIRPEHLKVVAGTGPRQATVQLVEDLGDHSIMHLDSTDGRILVKVEEPVAAEGETVVFDIPADEAHVFGADKRALPRLGN